MQRTRLAGRFHNEDYGHLRARVWASHPKGYYQPAVLTLHKTGQILYRWRCVPKLQHDERRAEAIYTWDKIKDGMQQTNDAAIDQNPVMGLKTFQFRFLLIMTAHGWFKTEPFHLEDGDKERVVRQQ